MNAVGNVPASAGGERATTPKEGVEKPVSPLESVIESLNRDFEGFEVQLTCRGTSANFEVPIYWNIGEAVEEFAREIARIRLAKAGLKYDPIEDDDLADSEELGSGIGFRWARAWVPLWRVDGKLLVMTYTGGYYQGTHRLFNVSFQLVGEDGDE